ncbi:hypothetical protein NM208_g6982 [Fusarium decemcellulare]|uniref:Uncharacterized protein n=1 Tax=Fusarium decemcellulare TaxID=57161 RepID=A0ACC1SB37_9HYPO|nr:hypothetical protein NM208_g6982 [Fusarium decemcellulare]
MSLCESCRQLLPDFATPEDDSSLGWVQQRHNANEAEAKAPIAAEQTPESIANAARHWISICDAEHSCCIERSLLSADAKMPTRLLDLGDSSSKTWRVCGTQGRGNCRKYYNYHQPDNTLPQSYQDIIAICRAIPIRYLWIDSLCILQDDNGVDFRREAPIMMDIYQHAYLTLTICWDLSDGTVFRKCRPRSIPRPPSIHYDQNDSDQISAPGKYAFIYTLSDFRINVTDSPINRRAWVLQERCLSRRILDLGNDQLYWECDDCTRPGWNKGLVASEAAPGFMYSSNSRKSIHVSPGSKRDGFWSAIVDQYTACELTYEQDRFVAIAGLARVMATVTGDTYLAGIWLEYWMKDIFWAPHIPRHWTSELKLGDEEADLSQLKPRYTAPSWSWLDFPGSIDTEPIPNANRAELSTRINSFQSQNCRPLATLAGYIITPPGSDPFVSLDRAILNIRCLLVPVEFGVDISLYRVGAEIELWLAYDVELRSVGWDSLRLGNRNRAIKQSCIEMLLSRPLNSSFRSFFVPLWLQKWSVYVEGGMTFNDARTYGLVVQETFESGNREFHRVGIWAEMFYQTPQLSPMISNTIVKQGIGKAGASTDGLTTPEEREFEYKLGDFATTQVSYSIDTDLRGDRKYDSSDELGNDESDHESDDGSHRMGELMSDFAGDKATSEENREAEDQESYDRSHHESDANPPHHHRSSSLQLAQSDAPLHDTRCMTQIAAIALALKCSLTGDSSAAGTSEWFAAAAASTSVTYLGERCLRARTMILNQRPTRTQIIMLSERLTSLYNQLSPESRAEIDARWGPPPPTRSNARTGSASNRVEVTENPDPAAELRRGTGPVLPAKFVPPSAASTPDSLFPFGLGLQAIPPVARFVRRDDPEQILVYTDGACLNNGQANPKAGWACVFRPEFMRPAGIICGRLENKGPSGESHNQTSNRAELRAVLGALHFQNWLAEGFTKLVIATDSEYVVKGATEWVRTWVRKGWKTRAGADVKNKDLWETLLELVKRWHDMGLTIQFWRIPRELNTEADRAAKSAAGSDEVPDQQRGPGFSTHLFYSHHDSVDDLEQCISISGCLFCALILSIILENTTGLDDEDDWEHADTLLAEATSEFSDDSVPQFIRESHSKIFKVPETGAIDPDSLAAPIVIELTFRKAVRLESANRSTDVVIHWTDENKVNTFLSHRDTQRDTNTGSTKALNLGRLWLQDCESTHQGCRQRRGSQAPLLPTRVIDVAGPSLHVSLPGQRDEYVALSHCWGKGKQFKTEMASLTDRQQGIVLTDMPKTFQDSILVTRHLGFRYIWIDSLCIIQDSKDDWLREAKEMGRYYRGASLTVFALDSGGDDEGCFNHRDGDANAPLRTPMFDPLVDAMASKTGSISFIQRILEHRDCFSMDDERHGFENWRKIKRPLSALNLRGWTLQEWILSTRSLVFTSSEIEWVYPSMSACECLPEGVLDLPKSKAGGWEVLVKKQNRLFEDSMELRLSDTWCNITEEFSRRTLTFPGDKLPALAGIALEFSAAKSGDYVAGLWNDQNLRNHLAWYVPPIVPMQGPSRTSRPPQYRAPSWSWASIDGIFRTALLSHANVPAREPELRSDALVCNVLGCWTVPRSTLNPLGEVSAGAVTLKGRLRRARVSQEQQSRWFTNRRVIYHENPDHELGWFDPDDQVSQFPFSDVWCMLLLGSASRLRGIALVEATAEERRQAESYRQLETKVYKRVGVVEEKWNERKPGDVAAYTYVIGSDSVDYDRNEGLSTTGALLDWFEAAEEAVINVI